MPRILHVISNIDLRKGGTAKTALDLTCALAKQGLNVSLLSTSEPGDQLDSVRAQLKSANVDVEIIGPVHGKFMSHPDLRQAVQRRVANADVVHIHAMWEDIQHEAAVAARTRGVPYIWLPQGMLDPWSLSQSKWKKKAVLLWRARRDLNGATAMHYTTDVERDLVAPLGLRPPVIIEPLGIDLSEYADLPPRGSFIAKFPQLNSKRIILFLSRVHLKKGLDLLLPAFAKSSGPNDILAIAGPVADGYQPTLDRIIADSGARDRVLLTGMLHGRDRLAAMVDADLFVLSSYQENFGIAVAEAVAVGCPTIISDQVNIWKELKANSAAGVVPTQVEPLAAMMKQWLGDDELRKGYATRGKAFARSRYDWTQIAINWKAHYEKVAAGAKRPTR